MSLSKLLLPALFLLTPFAAGAQEEGLLPTQTLVRADSKLDVLPDASTIQLELENKPARINSLTPLRPGNTQVALLIDDGLSRSAGIQLQDIKSFATSLPAGTELLVGYMTNGRVEVAQPFTTDLGAAQSKIRLPFGVPGQSASPYFCLSDFVKHWPGDDGGSPKARIALMITNGVDPYNGSTRLDNEDSPYVQSAIDDAQRAGVMVSSIYYRDSGFRGGSSAISGQGYLQQLADATGGQSYYEGTLNPVSLAPFFKHFSHDLAETYVATFDAPAQGGGRSHLIRVKMNSTVPKLKIRHADVVRPGNRESTAGQ